MFNDAKLLKRFCNECGNITVVTVTKPTPLTHMSHKQIFTMVRISVLIIVGLELAKLLIK